MSAQRLMLVMLLAIALVGPTWAGPFSFLRKKPAQPAQPAQPMSIEQRAGELIVTLKTDQDGNRRQAAAEELRDQDARAHPEVIPVLIEAAQRDTKAEVRLAAVQSLGRIRPVTQDVGRVIEQVVNSDSSMRVRLSARSTLWQYQLAGYRGGNPATPPPAGPPLPNSTQEPPLAESPAEAGPALTPPSDAPGAPQLYPQPLPAGPPIYPAPSAAPQPPRLAPVPAGRRQPTSWAPPADSQNGAPLSSYRLIAPPTRVHDAVIEQTVAPLSHEEVIVTEPRPAQRRFMVDLPAPSMAQPVLMQNAVEMVPVELAPVEGGPALNAPQ